MRKSGFVFFLVLIILQMGCKRERGTYVFTGKTLDQYSLTPIPYAKVTFTEYYDSGRDEKTTLGSTTTDQNGNFSFESDRFKKGFKFLEIYVSSPDYYAIGYTAVGNLQSQDNITVPCASHSIIDYTFINTTPFDQNDALSNVYIDRPFGNQWVYPSAQALAGTTVDTTVWTSFCGYSSSVLHYTVTKNAITQNYTDTINTPDRYQWIRIQDTIRY